MFMQDIILVELVELAGEFQGHQEPALHPQVVQGRVLSFEAAGSRMLTDVYSKGAEL